MIEVDGVDVSYGTIQVVWDVSLRITDEDTIVGLIGPNGAGKSTLLKAIAGLHPIDSGSISVLGLDVTETGPVDIVDAGYAYVPEEHNLFGGMTVEENLDMGAYTRTDGQTRSKERVFETFPVLKEKRSQPARTLSGGEQQMLAIGRGLMSDPSILVLDEPSEGLAPKITDVVFETVQELSDDITIVLVEQQVNRTLEIADRAYLLENGQIVAEDTGPALLESEQVKRAYLRD